MEEKRGSGFLLRRKIGSATIKQEGFENDWPNNPLKWTQRNTVADLNR